ncbi:MAG: Gfo/Idh/MocA family oxidoreductase [Pirellulaceae bacterium]
MANKKQLRYAVVGLGHIAQTAVLPAFEGAQRNSVVTALISDDKAKLSELKERHRVAHVFAQSEFDACLTSGEVDALYIAAPNHLHCEYTVRAAEAGIHVLCEKPMAITVEECEKMLHAVEAAGTKLMIAYRLHFDAANLQAIEIATSGTLGDVRIFHSVFAIDVEAGNVRLQRELGGGTLYDLGVYCINAARYIFQDEPIQAVAFSANNGEPRFAETDEMTAAILRFPGDRLATFTTSFGLAPVDAYSIVGTKGELRVVPGYDYTSKLTHHLTVDGKTKKKAFRQRDQFAAELLYFSNCVLRNKPVEPNAREGLIDVQIVQALYQSAQSGKPVPLDLPQKQRRPTLDQEFSVPPSKEAEPMHADSPQVPA